MAPDVGVCIDRGVGQDNIFQLCTAFHVESTTSHTSIAPIIIKQRRPRSSIQRQRPCRVRQKRRRVLFEQSQTSLQATANGRRTAGLALIMNKFQRLPSLCCDPVMLPAGRVRRFMDPTPPMERRLWQYKNVGHTGASKLG